MNSQSMFASASEDFRKGDYINALASLNRLLDVQRDAKTYALLGKTLAQMKLTEEAAQAYELAAENAGTRSLKYSFLAMQLFYECGKTEDAIRIGLPLIEDMAKDADMAHALGKLMLDLGLTGKVGPLQDVLLKSSNRNHNRVAVAPMIFGGIAEERAAIVEQLLRRHPKDTLLRSVHMLTQRDNNNYPEIEKYEPEEMAEIAAGNYELARFENPLLHLRWCGSEPVNFVAGQVPFNVSPRKNPAARHAMPHRWGKKIRVGYLSADFWRDHAVMKALTNVLQRHDREKFDIFLFDATPLDALRDNVDRSTWGKIVRIQSMPDNQAAEGARELDIDVMVDLQGWTSNSRAPIFNHMMAPIQVGWLGYPSTVINIDTDYIIGDATVTPASSAQWFHEKICRLPETFFPNDPINRPLPAPFTRAEIGLPDDKFIFASFNSAYKISLTTIELWIRILNETPDSILWFVGNKQNVVKNIAAKLEAGGVSRSRLMGSIFANDYAEHLGRIRLADVGLDTYPYNGHTTTSEQLWAGLPLLTYKGTNFASRVSESLLNAIGLPEMVADDPEDFVRRAVDLYNNREKVEEYKQRLVENRFRKPLYDSERFCHHLERAYEMMVERAKAGLKPDHFDVPALPSRDGPFLSR